MMMMMSTGGLLSHFLLLLLLLLLLPDPTQHREYNLILAGRMETADGADEAMSLHQGRQLQGGEHTTMGSCTPGWHAVPASTQADHICAFTHVIDIKQRAWQ
jgi:hypothetical protein